MDPNLIKIIEAHKDSIKTGDIDTVINQAADYLSFIHKGHIEGLYELDEFITEVRKQLTTETK